MVDSITSITEDLNTEIEKFQNGLSAFLPNICNVKMVHGRNTNFIRKKQRNMELSQKAETSVELDEFFNKSDEAKQICQKLFKPCEEVSTILNQMAVDKVKDK